MSLRTDKVSGVITLVFGIVLIAFATYGLLILAVQRLLMVVTPEMAAAVDAIQQIWVIYFPIMIIGGFVYAIAGFYILRGSLVARRIAQANAICGYAWVMAYSIRCYEVMDVIGPHNIGEPARSVLQWSIMFISVLSGMAFPTALLYLLSRPRNWNPTASAGEATPA